MRSEGFDCETCFRYRVNCTGASGVCDSWSPGPNHRICARCEHGPSLCRRFIHSVNPWVCERFEAMKIYETDKEKCGEKAEAERDHYRVRLAQMTSRARNAEEERDYHMREYQRSKAGRYAVEAERDAMRARAEKAEAELTKYDARKLLRCPECGADMQVWCDEDNDEFVANCMSDDHERVTERASTPLLALLAWRGRDEE